MPVSTDNLRYLLDRVEALEGLHDEAKRDVSRLVGAVEGLEEIRLTCASGHTSTIRELRGGADCSAPCCPRDGCDECSFTFEPSDALDRLEDTDAGR